MRRSYKYYDLIMAAFVTVILCSNIIGAGKLWTLNLGFLGQYVFSAGVLFFPISYVFGDILTEVYGYGLDRRVVWAGFGALFFASFMSWIIVALPPAEGWTEQSAYAHIFGQTPRIVLGSLIGFWAGSFVNSFILAKMKIKTLGKHLWMRTIGSTIGGELVDSFMFFPIAFYGIWPNDLLVQVILTNYVTKVVWETVLTPATYGIVNFLKRVEKEDFYDRNTRFTPFSLEA